MNNYTEIIEDTGVVEHGSVAFLFLEMKLSTLLDHAIADLRSVWHVRDQVKAQKQIWASEMVHRCKECNVECIVFAEDSCASCPQCGLSRQIVLEDTSGYRDMSCYNTNPRHTYAKKEHFFQTLLDISCMGRRHIPPDVFNYCQSVLGRGMHITYRDVFRALQIGGYSKYYCIKYNIAAGLRGRPEVDLTLRESEQIRGHYMRYDRHFHEFQLKYKLGKRGSSGRLRLYWPVRFIIIEMFKLIGRHDLVSCVKPVVGRDKANGYEHYWHLLKYYVEQRNPANVRPAHALQLTRLPGGKGTKKKQWTCPRRPLGPVHPSSS